jgi:hypothetical protein
VAGYDSAGTQKGYSTDILTEKKTYSLYLLTEKKTSAAGGLKNGTVFAPVNSYSSPSGFQRNAGVIRRHRTRFLIFLTVKIHLEPPPWSSGQTSWLQTQRSRVRMPMLPDFLSGSGSGTGSTQPL